MNSNNSVPLKVVITSFAYKYGVPIDSSPHGGGYVFDCRCIQNPGREAQFKNKTGLESDVAGYLEKLPEATNFRDHITGIVQIAVDAYLKRGFDHLSVSFGCTGGQHRSVYFAEYLRNLLARRADIQVQLCHREIEAGRAPPKAGAT